MGAADEEWEASQAMAQVRRDEETVRQTGTSLPPVQEQFARDAWVALIAATRGTKRQLAKVRILAPSLARPASVLIGRSGSYLPEGGVKAEQERDEAMWAFEAAAREALGIKLPGDALVRPTGEGGK